MDKKKLIIAVDGHSSCGKSTFAKAIAARMGYLYIDSGAMYRAVTLAFIEEGVIKGDTLDEEALGRLLDNITVDFRPAGSGSAAETYLNGINVEKRIRGLEVASSVSLVSTSAMVRRKMVALQQEMGKDKGIVMDGRDIGTVVFPDADIKIFLTASADIRAGRRYKELIEKGENVNFDEIRENILRRDQIDSTRKESPLKKAADAVVLDNSHMTPDEQMVWFENLLSERGMI
ncbi:MAG: (d)CMP kinase [Marinilabiliales bacterium]|nr:MAG: (d)CMP kinase [Marinilabiliales bacterium]